MDHYEAAVEMYKQEHTRWNQWALLFLGAIVSVFVINDKLHLPLRLASAMAAIISAMWVFAGISIRASTLTWRKTLEELSPNTAECPHAFKTYDKHLESFKRWSELGILFHF